MSLLKSVAPNFEKNDKKGEKVGAMSPIARAIIQCHRLHVFPHPIAKTAQPTLATSDTKARENHVISV